MSIPCHLPPATAQLVEVIYLQASRGDGTPSNPERLIDLYFSPDGRLLACYDPLNGPPDAFLCAQKADRPEQASADRMQTPH